MLRRLRVNVDSNHDVALTVIWHCITIMCPLDSISVIYQWTELGDNCIQICTVKRNFRPNENRRFTSPNDKFECSYPHSNAFINDFLFKRNVLFTQMTSAVSCVKSNASQWEATLRDDVGFPTVYRRIYRRKFLTLSNQTSRYIHKCIRISVVANVQW